MLHVAIYLKQETMWIILVRQCNWFIN